jgi:predicted Zn-dependent peptidase
MFKKTFLKNDLRVITIPQNSTEAITILVLVKTGSKYEDKEINGISHFLEHMLFKGTKKRPTPTAVAETLDRVGGIYNAFTGEEYTGFFAKVGSNHFDLALDWISDIILNSKLEEKEIEKEKGVIIEEINMYFDHPSSHVQNLWKELLYKDQSMGRNIAGSKETVMAISREKLIRYFKSQYVSSNMIICVAGRFEEREIFKKIEEKFKKINIGKPFNKPKVVEIQNKPECILEERKTDQAHFCLGVRSYNIFHPKRYDQDILAVILGGMMSSRLFIEVREKLGLAYYITTDIYSDTDTGFLVTQAGVDSNKVDKAIKTILKEYKKISQKRVGEKELKKAKDCIKGRMILGLERSNDIAFFYGMQEVLENKILTPKQIYEKIDKITSEDILKVAKDIFKPSKLNLALIGPFNNKGKFEKLLEI